jgi:hypothetical protein
VFNAAADFFEDPDTSTDENETVEAYDFHMNSLTLSANNLDNDGCN